MSHIEKTLALAESLCCVGQDILSAATGSTQEDPSWDDWKIIDCDVKNQNNNNHIEIKNQEIVLLILYSFKKKLNMQYSLTLSFMNTHAKPHPLWIII